MGRIANLASNEVLLARIFETQKRLFETEVQVSSEKKSQNYAGISKDAERLVNLENTSTELSDFIRNNDTANLRLDISTTVLDAIRDAIENFQEELSVYSTGNLTDQNRVADIQSAAFRGLQAIEGFLNTEVDGRYLFSGARVRTEPANLGLTNLSAFQSTYNGSTIAYPTTRDAHLTDVSLNKVSATGQANWLTFVRDNGGSPPRSRVTSVSNEFANVKVGSKITISGTGSINNGTYTVAAVTANTIDIVTEMLTNEGPVAAATLTDVNNNLFTSQQHGGLTFVRDNGAATPKSRITAATAGSLSSIAVGTKITIAGTTNNNGSYTVAANDGTNIDIVTSMFRDFGNAANRYFTFTAAANLSFVDGGASADSITAPAGTFRDGSGNPLPAGVRLTIAGTGTANDGQTYTIASTATDGSSVTLISSNAVTAAANTNGTVTTTESAGTIATTPYYNGDQVSLTHRVDDLRSFEIDFTAIHPAFEKAIRAMSLIAQGAYRSEGGLDQNEARVGQARYLLSAALEDTVAGTPPFGTEQDGNLENLEQSIGFKQVLIKDTNAIHKDFLAFLDKRVAEIENVDRLDAITRLLDDQRTLEASFQALARIKTLSLTQFLV